MKTQILVSFYRPNILLKHKAKRPRMPGITPAAVLEFTLSPAVVAGDEPVVADAAVA